MGKKWGFDLDGVIVGFSEGFRQRVIAVTGRHLFTEPTSNPAGWSRYLRDLGYTQTEIDRVWASLDDEFWSTLPDLPGRAEFNDALPDFVHDDIYFITARKSGKSASEAWLFTYTGIMNPTVLRTKQKGLVARALGLDVYVDDRLDLAIDVRLESPSTRVYLLDSPSNAYDAIDGITRVKTLAEMFEIELAETRSWDGTDANAGA